MNVSRPGGGPKMILIFSGSETLKEDNIFGTFRALELIKIHGSSAVQYCSSSRTEETTREVKQQSRTLQHINHQYHYCLHGAEIGTRSRQPVFIEDPGLSLLMIYHT